jgi:hypothetical protein
MNLVALISAGIILGFFMPLFSHLPLLNALNCIPFGWIWISGFLAVALYRWLLVAEESLTGSKGAIVGVFTGIVAAFTSLILAIFLGSGGSTVAILASAAPILKRVENAFAFIRLEPGSFMFLFLFNLTLFPVISGIGGLIGVALFGKSGSRESTY